jgi:predicted HAD superfamily Cof-like phosphohydrolase
MRPADAVREFREQFGQPISDVGTFGEREDQELAAELIEEECDEASVAILCASDLEAVALELADILYVVYGAGLTFGIDVDKAFAIVHEANMAKLWDDGTAHHRADGKVLKPPGYVRPDLSPAIKAASE